MKYGFFYLIKVSIEETKLINMKEKCAAVLLSIKVVPTVLILITGMLFALLKRHTYSMKFSFLQFMLDCLLAYYYTLYLSLKNCIEILIATLL